MKIESLQNQTVKNLVRLQTRKERQKTGQFLIETPHMIEEAANAGLLEHVYQLEELPVLSEPVTFCSQAVLNKISANKSDAKYIGVCRFPKVSAANPQKVLLLDRLQDPGNVGTLIRCALAFGIDQVLLSADCADIYSTKVLQSSQGAIFHLPCKIVSSLTEEIENFKSCGLPVFGAALHQDSTELHDLKIPSCFGIVIGNEGQGISQSVLDACSQLIHIEMQTFESLNAAAAGSILLYAFQFPTES